MHDAFVVGAGPAGLAGALYLARFRREVCVVDAGDSRASRIPHSHNVAGFPGGISGDRLLQQMRRQVAALGVTIVPGHVDAIKQDCVGFELAVDGSLHRSRTVLLATGARDIEPPMEQAQTAIERGALRYCPVCDGYEVAGCDVGVLCDGARGAPEALYLRHFSARVRLFVMSPVSFDRADLSALHDAGICVHEEPVSSIRLEGKGVAIVHGAQTTRCDSLYSALGMKVASTLATQIGAEDDADGYVISDRHQHTRVAGFYVAGDVARGLNQISVAIGEAAIAASAMHLRLREVN